MWNYFFRHWGRINLCLTTVNESQMNVHQNSEVDKVTNRRRTPGNVSHGFFDMLSDVTAPPQVGPFVWMLFSMILYTYRGVQLTPYVLLVASSTLNIMYIEFKRHQSTTQQTLVAGARNANGYGFSIPANATAPSALAPLGMISLVSGKSVRVLLYTTQIAIIALTILFSGSTSVLWLLIMMQLSLCVAFYLEHANQISRIRRAYCETDTTGGASKACRMQF
jgi:hypothetical protein